MSVKSCRWFILAMYAFVILLSACASSPLQDEISLSPSSEDGYWKVVYRLAQPTTALTLARTPDDARRIRWKMISPGLEIGTSDSHDIIRHTDGKEFSSVEISVPATYVPLPKDYAPFSPFSDGGLLIHSGRFQACPTDLARSFHGCNGPWSMDITAPQGSYILLNGQIYGRSARWSDIKDGTKIYVGTYSPSSSEHFVSIVDSELPPAIANMLSTILPEMMKSYAQRLPPLPYRPMLFVSYDPDYSNGRGRQGGTLPGQVFMHFYGTGWDGSTSDDSSPEDVAWFFAHESGHLFQHGVAGSSESSWIHEGSAEAFAYLMLENQDIVPAEYLAVRQKRAFDGCRDALNSGTLHSAAERGSFRDYYHCGLIMFLAVDSAIRVDSNNQRNLFDFWTTLIHDSNENERWSAREFLDQLEISINPHLAKVLNSIVFEEQANPAAVLDQLASY